MKIMKEEGDVLVEKIPLIFKCLLIDLVLIMELFGFYTKNDLLLQTDCF